MDADGVKVEQVGMRLLPHQVFIMPKAYYTRLRNKAALQEETGLTPYYAPFLGYFLRGSLSKHMHFPRKNKNETSYFFSRYIHQADREPADHRRIPITLTVNPSERITSPLVKPLQYFFFPSLALTVFYDDA